MPRFIPKPLWDGEDVFIVGGGPSLKDFNWDLLRDENVIGCNDAYLLGEDICDVCIFGDKPWFAYHYESLKEFKGLVITNHESLLNREEPWLFTIARIEKGLHHEALGWNGNTGASAINLALLLGARRIYLLGFDMKQGRDNENNWHINEVSTPDTSVYDKYLKKFAWVAKDLKMKFPNCSVYNISDDTALTSFPVLPVDEFWKMRKDNYEVDITELDGDFCDNRGVVRGSQDDSSSHPDTEGRRSVEEGEQGY